MEVFNWDNLREELSITRKRDTRDIVIERAFQQWIEGHDGYEDKSKPEMDELFHIFKAAWIIRDTL